MSRQGRREMVQNPLITPAEAGFRMPPEWARHAACLMAWPARPELWGERLDEVKGDYAAVARAIADFEPVVMVCQPGTAAEVRDLCGTADILPVEIPINDSWTRDSGPVFVRDAAGGIAVVQFGFNAWGGRWHPHDDDARLATRIGERLGLPVFHAPFVLEGGAFYVDGDGTVLTTEQCLLNPNRNPDMTRGDIERALCDYLGASTVVWLPYGHSFDVGPEGTDGHIDGVAQLVGPGHVLLEAPATPGASEYSRSQHNLAALRSTPDAAGRAFRVSLLDPGPDAAVSYANHYLANDAVIVPVNGDGTDEAALKTLAEVYPGREIVAVPGATIALGGGGPHCITQQIPEGVDISVLR
ncbi:agmatine deiminase family protein [Longispora fulva]|uniref:Agmatine deiminase n=1 Tax=Longispora fulva TaxID=619741 RepID=A0A8J7GTP5_9ACTN|nr:agmatine deiminase family protein [Longispora fulva]MBG6137056.1 agmatine deiminase [Longispora fulva]